MLAETNVTRSKRALSTARIELQCLMTMLMVRIGEMGMRVRQQLVPMPVAMLRARRDWEAMRMLVVRVMDMFMLMLMLNNLMRVFVLVVFGQVKPNTNRH